MNFDDRRMVEKEELLSILKARNIPFAYEDHERVLNMAESSELRLSLEGTRCKNLLLQDKQGHVYLVVTTSEKALDLSAAAKSIGSKGCLSRLPNVCKACWACSQVRLALWH